MKRTQYSDFAMVMGVSLAALAVASMTALCLGIRVFSPVQVFSVLMAPSADSMEALVVWSSRLPRLAIAVLVGAALGLSGAILQTVSRNILADPGLLGINAGAALAVVICVAILGEAPALRVVGLASVTGAFATGALVYGLAGGADGIGRQPLRLILSGAVVMMTLGSITHVLLLLMPNTLEVTQLWLSGSVADRPASMLPYFLPGLAAAILAGLILSQSLTVLVLGAVQAQALGVNVVRLRVLAVVVAAVLCGLAVSLAGPLAFVGLIAPHAARTMLGPKPVFLFPLSVVFGALSVVIADVLARMFVAPAEWPVGVVLAFMGVPVYLSILMRRKSPG